MRDLNEALRQPAKPEYSCVNFIIHKTCSTGAKILYIANEVLLPTFRCVASKNHYNESGSVVVFHTLLFQATAITLSYKRVRQGNQSIRHNEGRKQTFRKEIRNHGTFCNELELQPHVVRALRSMYYVY